MYTVFTLCYLQRAVSVFVFLFIVWIIEVLIQFIVWSYEVL